MNATPLICPECGELIIAGVSDAGAIIMIPVHLDRITPAVVCTASARIASARIRQPRIL